MDEQIPDDNQGLPSNKEMDEERISQSNEQVISISKNKNSHKGEKTIIDLNEAKTNYQTKGINLPGRRKKIPVEKIRLILVVLVAWVRFIDI